MSFGNEKKLSGYLPVVMKNELTRAKYSMELNERRLLYVAMSKINPYDTDFQTVTFTISEYISLLEKSMNDEKQQKGGKTYELIKEGCKNLLKRLVEIQDGKKWTAFQWVSKATVNEETGEITLKFHDDMKPYLLYMLENKGFTKFLLKFALPLNSTYAQHFYEMFRGLVYERNERAVCKVQYSDLREKLVLGKKYPNYADFKRFILDIAEREINQKTDIYISFKEVRKKTKGRPIVAILVSVILKANMVHEWDRFMLWQKDDLLEKLYYLVERSKGQKLNLERLEKYSHESIARLTYEINEGKIDLLKINNHQGFIEWKLDQWQTDIGMDQISLEETKPD